MQQQLQQRGFDPGEINGQFGAATDKAVRAFQASVGLAVDGQAGPNTFAALEAPNITSNVTADLVAPLFPGAGRENIQFQLPLVLKGLLDAALADKSMVLMALGTIRAETGRYLPIDEGVSRFTRRAASHSISTITAPTSTTRGHQTAPPSSVEFFVQLTGRANYTHCSTVLGLGTQLVDDPDLANDPVIAAQLLATFLKDKEGHIRTALACWVFFRTACAHAMENLVIDRPRVCRSVRRADARSADTRCGAAEPPWGYAGGGPVWRARVALIKGRVNPSATGP